MNILRRIRWDMIIVWIVVPGVLWFLVFLVVMAIARKMGLT